MVVANSLYHIWVETSLLFGSFHFSTYNYKKIGEEELIELAEKSGLKIIKPNGEIIFDSTKVDDERWFALGGFYWDYMDYVMFYGCEEGGRKKKIIYGNNVIQLLLQDNQNK